MTTFEKSLVAVRFTLDKETMDRLDEWRGRYRISRNVAARILLVQFLSGDLDDIKIG